MQWSRVASDCWLSSDGVTDMVSAGTRALLTGLGCLFAPVGNLFLLPQKWHVIRRISAHGFFPFLLWFSTTWVALCPTTSTALQILQMDLFRSLERRSCAFLETCWRSDPSWRATGEGFENVCSAGKAPVLRCRGSGSICMLASVEFCKVR